MKITSKEAVYAVLKLVVNQQITLPMVYNDLWM